MTLSGSTASRPGRGGLFFWRPIRAIACCMDYPLRHFLKIPATLAEILEVEHTGAFRFMDLPVATAVA